MAPFLLLVFVSFLGWSVYGLVRARRTRAEALRVQRLVREARHTSIQDAPEAGRIVVSGKATESGSELVTAPFSGESALWARAWLQTNVGDLIEEWIERVDEIIVDDGSGRIARLDPSAVRIRLPERSVGGSENAQRIADYLTARGFSRSGKTGGFEYESALRPGDHVSVMGTVAAVEAGYRSSSADLRFSDSDEIVLFDPMLEPSASATADKLVGCAIFGIVFFALASLVTLAVMIQE